MAPRRQSGASGWKAGWPRRCGAEASLFAALHRPLTHLRSLGYVTLDAANDAEALAIAENNPKFDLLFTDVIMPGEMNDRELADAIQSDRPDLKVLYTSSYIRECHHPSRPAGCGVMLLATPYRKSDLARMIRSAGWLARLYCS
jgi:CheY-like chemotaxis protein